MKSLSFAKSLQLFWLVRFRVVGFRAVGFKRTGSGCWFISKTTVYGYYWSRPKSNLGTKRLPFLV